MKRYLWLIITLVLIIVGAATDYFLFKGRTFLGYIFICLWEFFLFFCGVSFGRSLEREYG